MKKIVLVTLVLMLALPAVHAQGLSQIYVRIGTGDDNDPARFPGNVEVFNDNDKDQDCNPETHGYFSAANNSRQICDGRDKVVIASLRGSAEIFTRAACIPGTVCVQQPNGDGVCMTEPPRYQAPSAAVLPSGPQRMPAPPVSQNPEVRKRLLETPINLPLNSGDKK